MSGGYDMVIYDNGDDLYVPYGNPNPSPYHFNPEALAFAEDILRRIFIEAQPEGDFPYTLEPSESRANIVDDLATLQANFVLDPPE